MAITSLLSGFSPATEVQAIKDLLFAAVVKGEAFGKMHNVRTGVTHNQEVGLVGLMGNVGLAGNACSKTSQTVALPITKKTWTPTQWHIYIEQCFNDLESTIANYSNKTGVDRNDMTGTDLMDIIAMTMEEAMVKMTWRLTWFNDLDAANYNDSPAGYIKNSVSPTFYNMLDGFWAQIDTIVAADALRLTAIAENGQATYATQKISEAHAYDAIEAVYTNAKGELKQANDRVIYANGDLVDKYLSYKAKTYGLYNEAYKILSSGDILTDFMGVPVYGLRVWDYIIQNDFDNGTKYYRPSRVVMTTKSNLGVAVDSEKSLKDVKVIFEDKTDLMIFKAAGFIDAKIAQDNLVQVAY